MKHLGYCSGKGESKLLVNFDSIMDKCRFTCDEDGKVAACKWKNVAKHPN